MKIKELVIKLRAFVIAIYEDVILRTYNNLFGHQALSRFVILGHARTGSNYLLDGIISSKIITAYHEIFADHNRKIGQNFDKILSQLYRNESRNTRIVGFKLFYNHLTDEEWSKFISHEEFKIIHLTRANRLRTIVSLDVAFKTDEWTRSSHSREKKLVDKRITLNTTTLLGRLEKIETQESLARERFTGRPMLEVVYEEMVKDPQRIFQTIGKFLEVDDIDFTKIKIMRQNSEKLDQLIINYDEVYQLLKDTKFADCLKD
jgi:LPS sulfotransferase NodH